MVLPNDYNAIPSASRSAILGWLMFGWNPGSFIRSILNNDLVESAEHADDRNIHLLHVYACFMRNEMPMNAWRGSQKNWCESRKQAPMPPGALRLRDDSWKELAQDIWDMEWKRRGKEMGDKSGA